MAVYTQVSAEAMAVFLKGYDVGTLISAKGIAEGVENSNYLIDTCEKDSEASRRFILTLYEKRVAEADLPFFASLLDHVADRGCPVPRMIADREGQQLQALCGRPAALIEFLPGVSVSHPTPEQAHATGAALGSLHRALADFGGARRNALGPQGWFELAEKCAPSLGAIRPGLRARVEAECVFLRAHWPADLPRSVIHADLFPDNVLMLGDRVSGLIDFYFACTEIRAWDVAVTHAAWAFDAADHHFRPEIGDAILDGYETTHGLSAAERAIFPILARGACLRFLLTRAWDWLNTPADALVSRKDPLDFLKRLEHYAAL